MYPMMGGGGGMWSIVLVLLVTTGIAVAALVLALRPRAPQPPNAVGPTSGTTAAEVLRMRYARGDIDKDEFERRMAALRPSAR